jgi:K+-transporting ATPase ATPase A chain
MTMFGWSQAVFVLLVLVAVHVPLGDYMAQTLDGGRHLKAERWVYRICGVDPDGEQDWRHYLTALMAFSVASIVVLFALLTLQRHLPWSLGHGGNALAACAAHRGQLHHQHQLAELCR